MYVSYRDTTNSTTGSYNVFLSVSDNFGRKFTTLQLSNETYVTSLEADDYSPEVAASRGTVGVIWSSATGGYEQEYISLSGNAGVSFQTVKLDNSTYDRSSLLNVAGTEYYGMWESGTGVGVAVCA